MIVPATMKPCPFCGGEAKFTDGGPGRGFVHCGACSASCDDGSREYAVNAWNKRATDTIVPADVAELVIAARIVAFEDQSPEALRALDKASEAFAERVPWENDPDEEQANARAADIALTVTPPPSPDVAGVKLADRVDLTGGVRPAHVLESLTESVNQAWAIIGDNARCSVPATFIGWLLQEYESLSAEKGRLEAAARLRPMSDAPKNRTPVLLQVKASLPRDDLRRWEGLQFVGHHSGNWDDGFDPGWNMSAPVGHGGFPDEWFDGWRPLIARTALTPKEKA